MKTTNIRIPDHLYEALKESAELNFRSLNSEIMRAIEFYLQAHEKEWRAKLKELDRTSTKSKPKK